MSEITVNDMGKNNSMLFVKVAGAGGSLIPKNPELQDDYISDAKKIIDLISGEGTDIIMDGMDCNAIGLNLVLFFCTILQHLGYNGESHKDNFKEVKEELIELLANPLPIL